MKIGLVSPYDLGVFGGVQDQVLKLGRWLRDAGHETLVVGPGHGPEGTVSLGPTRTFDVNGSAAPIRLDPRMRRLLQRLLGRCDVVHVHEPLMPMVGPVAARVTGPALVGTFHADPSRAVRRLYRVAAPMWRTLLRRFDVVTAVSPVAAGAIEHVVTPRLVPNGLDVDWYSAEPGNLHRVVFLGRDDPRKGLDVLLAAWPDVHQAIRDAELVVAAGDRRESIPGVEFVGRVTDDEKRRLLADAAVYCAPNIGGESFGITLVEAMASQCAVMASALPGFTHVLGDAGVLTKPGDAAGLAESLIALLEDPSRIGRLQQRGLDRVRRFDRAAVTAGYVAAYETAIEKASAVRLGR